VALWDVRTFPWFQGWFKKFFWSLGGCKAATGMIFLPPLG
jgi:hypothetical protein